MFATGTEADKKMAGRAGELGRGRGAVTLSRGKLV